MHIPVAIRYGWWSKVLRCWKATQWQNVGSTSCGNSIGFEVQFRRIDVTNISLFDERAEDTRFKKIGDGLFSTVFWVGRKR